MDRVTILHERIHALFSTHLPRGLNFDQHALFSLRSHCPCNSFDFYDEIMYDENACTSNGVLTKPRCGCRDWLNDGSAFCYTKTDCGFPSEYYPGAYYKECYLKSSTPPPPPSLPRSESCFDPDYHSQWHHAYVNLVHAWGISSGLNTSVVVVDTGIEATHPDLNMDENERYEWNDEEQPFDKHGTNCAGVIASIRNNYKGGCGVSFNSKLIDAPLLNPRLTQSQFESRLIDTYTKFENRSDILFSNSWGPVEYSSTVLAPSVQAMFDDFSSKRNGLGTILIWAAGNGFIWDNVNDDPYNSHVSTITVTSSSEMLYRSYYSEFGSCIDVTAPSNGGFGLKGIFTTTLNAEYIVSFGGTSAAAPTVAGIVALMLSKNSNLSVHDIRQILWKSCTVIDRTDGLWMTNSEGYEYSPIYGFGLVDAYNVMKLLSNYTLLSATRVFHKLVNETQLVNTVINTEWLNLFHAYPHKIALQSVELFLDISHEYKGDFDLSLVSPSGTIAPLAYYIPKEFYTSNEITSTRYVPHSYLVQNFFEESSDGIWELRIRSGERNDEPPQFNSFRMTFYGHTSSQYASIKQDPHISFANGEMTDMRGVPGHFYNIFTSSKSFMNAKFDESLFKLHRLTVNGTFLTEFYYATQTGFVHFRPLIQNPWRRIKVSCGGRAHHIFYRRNRDCSDFKVERKYSSIRIKDESTEIVVRMMPIYKSLLGPTRRLDIFLSYHGYRRAHGLIGQSFNNKYFRCKQNYRNIYTTYESYIETEDQVDGCIEGNVVSYEVSQINDHDYKYSLFSKE